MGPGPWPLVSSKAPRCSQNAPLPGEGHAYRPEASPGVPAAPPQPLYPLRPGLGDLGPRGHPASEGAGLEGRPPRASACFSTGGSGAPMSWRPCLAPWLSWSWGPWSVSPGAPAWTSLKTSGVGAGPLSREGIHEALAPEPPGHMWPTYHAWATAGSILGSGVEARAPLENRCGWRRGARGPWGPQERRGQAKQPLLGACLPGSVGPTPGLGAGRLELRTAVMGAGRRAWALRLSCASKIKTRWWHESFWNVYVQGPRTCVISPVIPMPMRKRSIERLSVSRGRTARRGC